MKLITIPLNRPIQVGDVIKSKIHYDGLSDYVENANPTDNTIVKLDNYYPIQLLLVSDDEVKRDDIVIKNTNVHPCLVPKHCNTDKCKKIITSYPQYETLPSINKKDLQYIIELLNKGIDEIELEEVSMIHTTREHLLTGSKQWKKDLANPVMELKLIDNCVCIVKRQEEKTATNELMELFKKVYPDKANDGYAIHNFYSSYHLGVCLTEDDRIKFEKNKQMAINDLKKILAKERSCETCVLCTIVENEHGRSSQCLLESPDFEYGICDKYKEDDNYYKGFKAGYKAASNIDYITEKKINDQKANNSELPTLSSSIDKEFAHDTNVGSCSKHPSQSMINCPMCAIEEINDAKEELKEAVENAYIIVYTWQSCEDWNGCFPSNLWQQIVTEAGGRLPKHFYSYFEAKQYCDENCLINPKIVQVCGSGIGDIILNLPIIIELYKNAKTMDFKEYSDFCKKRLLNKF